MGGRGSSSGISVKGIHYGEEYSTLFMSGNIKFVKMNKIDGMNSATTAPMETMTKNRVYVTISNDTGKPKFVSYYDKNNKRYKQIDLSGKTHYVGKKKLDPPHTHLGYEHEENGSRRLSVKERKMVANVWKLWDNHTSK